MVMVAHTLAIVRGADRSRRRRRPRARAGHARRAGGRGRRTPAWAADRELA
ncbi:MAG: hypothetical protein ACLTMP_00565 [Eggerthella lenta]